MPENTTMPQSAAPAPTNGLHPKTIHAEPRPPQGRVGSLSGSWTPWVLCDVPRQYGTIQCLPYEQAVEFLVAVPYRGETGKGQQRQVMESQVKSLMREMRAGTYTPTPVAGALKPHHGKLLVLKGDQTFTLTVDTRDPLLLIDGSHRFAAIGRIIEKLKQELGKAKEPSEKEKLGRWIEQAKQLPCTVTVYFDGDPQQDFVNLQKGRAVDTSHMKSLTLSSGDNKDPALKAAFDIARLLNKDEKSPFRKGVKFDSRVSLPLPIATLTATGGSDIGTSLVGLARVGIAAGKDEKFLAAAVTDAFQALKAASAAEDDDGILEAGKVLTPSENHGSKGASTMLTGVGVCLAYRLIALKKDVADPTDLQKLVDAAEYALNKSVQGNFSGPIKRQLLGRFAKEFFADLTEARHQGVPVSLLKTLTCSTFAVKAMPNDVKDQREKERKARKEKLEKEKLEKEAQKQAEKQQKQEKKEEAERAKKAKQEQAAEAKREKMRQSDLPDLRTPVTVTTEPVTIVAAVPMADKSVPAQAAANRGGTDHSQGGAGDGSSG